MSRRKKPDQVIDLARFVAEVEQINKILVRYTGGLRIRSPHWQAMENLHAELIKAIKEVTGENAPWMSRSSTGPAVQR
jgi:hypothetical protein